MKALAKPEVLQLRQYQLDAREAFWSHEGEKGALLVMATGTGKTVTAHQMVVEVLERGGRVAWGAHRNELVTQPKKTLDRWWPQHSSKAGIVWRELNQYASQVVYFSKDSLRSEQRVQQLLSAGDFDLFIVDEAHRSMAPSWVKLIQRLRGPKTRLLGLTATPDREDTRQLSELWDVAFSYSILDALNEGALLEPYAAVAMVPEFDERNVKSTAADYVPADAEAELLRLHVVEHTVQVMREVHLAEALPFRERTAYIDPSKEGGILLFTATVRQAQLTAEALIADGWRVGVVSGETPKEQRKATLGRFERGELDVLCNAGVLTEGTDLPRANVVVVARPTKSWSLFVQMIGRALRLHGEQDRALILDLVGATRRHSIVAAPVLVDGIDCEESPDGHHRYLPLASGEGKCQHCGDLIACYAHKGGHRFKDGACKCGAIQCPESPSDQHDWVPWEPGKRRCVHCGMEIPDPTSSLKRKVEPVAGEVAWKRLSLRAAVVEACHLEDHGILFRVAHGEDWRPWWWTPSGGMRPLSRGPVPREMAALLTWDVARRTKKVKGRYGGRKTSDGYRIAFSEAEDLAYRERIWRVG